MKSFRMLIASIAAATCTGPALGQAAQAEKSASAPSPAPLQRPAFIQTMDAEFNKMDADKDGRLTKKEVEDYQRAVSILAAQQRNIALFQALDADKSGTLSPAEFAKLPMQSPPSPAPLILAMDLNRDGKITLVEYRTATQANFDRMDTDKDGIISAAEMKTAGLIN